MIKKIINGEEVKIKEGEFIYCGYFDFDGSETTSAGKIQKLSGKAIELLNTKNLKFKKVKDGWATEFAYQFLKERGEQ
jgi:hypothetical protein